MKAHTLLIIVSDVIEMLKSKGILTANGFDQTKVDSIAEDVEVGQAVVIILEKHGANVPDKVERVLAIIPLVAGIIR